MNDLVRQHTALSETDLEWLHLLVSEWQLLSDLSFADLVLWVPTLDGTRYVSVAQMRPNTGPTSYQDDMVGHLVPRGRRPLLDAALDEGRIVREGDPEWREEVPVRVESIPVRREGRVLGVIARNTNLLTVRTPKPAGADLPPVRLRPGPDDRRGLLPVPRPAGRHGRLPARRGRPDPPRCRRRGHLRVPERALRLPPARPCLRPGRAAPRQNHRRTRPLPRPGGRGPGQTRQRLGPQGDRDRGERRGHPAARDPAQAEGDPDRLPGALPRRHRTAPSRT